MKFFEISIIALILVFLLFAVPCLATSGGRDTMLDNLTSQIVTSCKITVNTKTRIAVIEFSDLQGNVPELGKYIAEELTTRLVMTNQFEVIERTLLNKVLSEYKLSLSGLIDENSAKEIGKILGVPGIITGTLTDLGDTVKVNARLINTETGSIAAVASVQITKDQAIQKLMGDNNTSVSVPNPEVQPQSVIETQKPSKREPKSMEKARQVDYNRLIQLGDKYLRQDLRDQAIETFTKAVDLDPKQRKAYQNLIEIYLQKQDYSQTLSWCQKATGNIDAFAYAYAAMGYCYMSLNPKNTDKAIDALTTAIAITEYPDPEGWTYCCLGWAFQEQGQTDKARTYLEKAIKKSSVEWRKNSVGLLEPILRNLIVMNLNEKNYQQALSISQEAVSYIDNFAYGYAVIGYCYLNIPPQKIDNALTFLHKAITINEYPDNEGWSYYILGMANQEKGKLLEAKVSYDKALDRCQGLNIQPDWSVDCSTLLDDIFPELIKEVIETKSKQLLTVCQEAITKYNLAYGYAGIGYYYMITTPVATDRAIEYLNKAIAISEYPDNEGWTYYILGWACSKKGLKAEAKNALEKAVARYQSVHKSAPLIGGWYHRCVKLLDGRTEINLAAGLTGYNQSGIAETATLIELHFGDELSMKNSRSLLIGLSLSPHASMIKAGAEYALEFPLISQSLYLSVPMGLGYYSSTEEYNYYDYGNNTVLTDYLKNSGFYFTVGAGLKYYLNKKEGIRLTAGADYFKGPDNFDSICFRSSLIIPF